MSIPVKRRETRYTDAKCDFMGHCSQSRAIWLYWRPDGIAVNVEERGD